MELKESVYTAIKSDLDLMTTLMKIDNQREITLMRWCNDKSDKLLKYPYMLKIAKHLKLKNVDDLIDYSKD